MSDRKRFEYLPVEASVTGIESDGSRYVFDPALAIGVYDHERPLPKSLIRFETRRAEPKKGPTKKQIAAAERAAVVLRSALDAATERALIERTPEAYAVVLGVMGKTR